MLTDPLLDVLSAVVNVLSHAGVEYAVTGSVASSLHGEPVFSQDIDLVVRMTPEQARRVARELPQRFYRNQDAVIEAAQVAGFVNLIDSESGLKVDLSVLPAGDFNDRVLERRLSLKFDPNVPAFDVVTAEDVILMKLLWRRDTRSAKQWENALSVARVKGARMDWEYLFGQAKKVGVEEDLERLRDEAGI